MYIPYIDIYVANIGYTATLGRLRPRLRGAESRLYGDRLQCLTTRAVFTIENSGLSVAANLLPALRRRRIDDYDRAIPEERARHRSADANSRDQRSVDIVFAAAHNSHCNAPLGPERVITGQRRNIIGTAHGAYRYIIKSARRVITERGNDCRTIKRTTLNNVHYL